MKRPKVVVYNIASVDGRVTLMPDKPLWGPLFEKWQRSIGSKIPTEVDKEIKSIHRPKACMEGSGSFVSEKEEPDSLPPYEDDPNFLYQDFLTYAVVNAPGRRGWLIVVDSRGRGRKWIKEGETFGEEWKGWHMLILASKRTPLAYLAYLQRENIPYMIQGEEHVDLRIALEKLKSKLGVSCVLSTAGGKLNGALLRAGLVDEINIEFFPAIIGGFRTPSLFDSSDPTKDEWPTKLKLISSRVFDDGHVWLRYEVIK